MVYSHDLQMDSKAPDRDHFHFWSFGDHFSLETEFKVFAFRFESFSARKFRDQLSSIEFERTVTVL